MHTVASILLFNFPKLKLFQLILLLTLIISAETNVPVFLKSKIEILEIA